MAFKTEHTSHSGGTCMFYVQDSFSHGGVIGPHTYVFQGCRPATGGAGKSSECEEIQRSGMWAAELVLYWNLTSYRIRVFSCIVSNWAIPGRVVQRLPTRANRLYMWSFSAPTRSCRVLLFQRWDRRTEKQDANKTHSRSIESTGCSCR